MKKYNLIKLSKFLILGNLMFGLMLLIYHLPATSQTMPYPYGKAPIDSTKLKQTIKNILEFQDSINGLNKAEENLDRIYRKISDNENAYLILSKTLSDLVDDTISIRKQLNIIDSTIKSTTQPKKKATTKQNIKYKTQDNKTIQDAKRHNTPIVSKDTPTVKIKNQKSQPNKDSISATRRIDDNCLPQFGLTLLQSNTKAISIDNCKLVEERETKIGKIKRQFVLIDSNRTSKKILNSKVIPLKKIFDQKQINLQKLTTKIDGPIKFNYKGVQYAGFIADKNKHNVALHWGNEANKPILTLPALRAFLVSKKEEVLMLTNAGMYDPNYKPQGLFLTKQEKITSLDTTKPVNTGNFYLQPNGVFWLDSKGFSHISTTNTFKINQAYTHFKNKTEGAKFATQSGPMLVIDAEINHIFTKGSLNRKIRSGVGVTTPSKTVFLCSLNEDNFINIATLFANIFGCKNALFLDGAISKMYIPYINADNEYGHFGPMISVTENLKTKEK